MDSDPAWHRGSGEDVGGVFLAPSLQAAAEESSVPLNFYECITDFKETFKRK